MFRAIKLAALPPVSGVADLFLNVWFGVRLHAVTPLAPRRLACDLASGTLVPILANVHPAKALDAPPPTYIDRSFFKPVGPRRPALDEKIFAVVFAQMLAQVALSVKGRLVAWTPRIVAEEGFLLLIGHVHHFVVPIEVGASRECLLGAGGPEALVLRWVTTA
jgi:hypothetical protein